MIVIKVFPSRSTAEFVVYLLVLAPTTSTYSIPSITVDIWTVEKILFTFALFLNYKIDWEWLIGYYNCKEKKNLSLVEHLGQGKIQLSVNNIWVYYFINIKVILFNKSLDVILLFLLIFTRKI